MLQHYESSVDLRHVTICYIKKIFCGPSKPHFAVSKGKNIAEVIKMQ